MPQPKTIRLRGTVRSGNLLFPNNAVIDAPPDVADDLVNRNLAEYTDAAERYPIPFPGYVSDAPVSGAEKFPAPPGVEPVTSSALLGTEGDKRAEREAAADVGPVYDHPEKVGDESSPAKPDEADGHPAKKAKE